MESVDLHLMRHGAPEVPGLMLGRTDAASSLEGSAACRASAERLMVEVVVSSDLARAATPARLIAEARGVPLAVDPRWRELDFGDWDGLDSASIDPEALGLFWTDPDRHAPPGGERWSALVERVGAAVDALSPQPTLVVTHGGAMRAALAHLCGFGQRQLWAFSLPYGALLSLRLWPGDPRTAEIIGLTA